MNCVKLFYLLSVVATCCVAFTPPPDIYPVMALETLSGENEAKALEFLDATLTKLVELTDGTADFKIANISTVMAEMVSAKKLAYQVELTQNDVTKLCDAIIWHQFWMRSGGTNFQLRCENETSFINSIF